MLSTRVTWSGNYTVDDKQIELIFKDFKCPIEGGDIIGHTNDDKTVEGKIDSKRKLVFKLKDANGGTLYFEGSMAKDLNSIAGTLGVEEDNLVFAFKFVKKEEQIVEIWHGYYERDEKQIVLKFKDFTCPIQGGVITGNTNDGKTVEGKIESNRKLVFTLKDAIGGILYF
jgi:hypothetical protein